MRTLRLKPFALTGRASGRRSRAPRDRRSSGRWKNGWRSSRSGSGRTHIHASSPAGAAARAGWPGLFPRQRGRSRHGKTSPRSVGGHNRPISNVAAAAGGGAGADLRRANPEPYRLRFRHAHPRRRRGGEIGPHPDPRPRRERAPSRIQIAAAAVEVGAGVAASDRAVRQARAARQAPVTVPRPADPLRIRLNTPE